MSVALPATLVLNSRNGWRTSGPGAPGVVDVREAGGLRLTPTPGGPDAVDSPDGTLGGLIPPRGWASDAGGALHQVTVETDATVAIWRYEGAERRRVRSLARPRNKTSQPLLAIVGERLCVAWEHDPTLVLLGAADEGTQALEPPEGGWSPLDLAASQGRVIVLDAAGRVFAHDPLAAGSRLLCAAPADVSWRRLAADDEGRLLLAAVTPQGEARLDVRRPDGGELSPDERHGLGLLRIDVEGRSHVTPLLDGHALRPLFARSTLARTRGPSAPGVRRSAASPNRYAPIGRWVSAALDSGLYDCAWDQVELVFDSLPRGAQVVARSFTSGELPPEGAAPATEPYSPAWSDPVVLAADPDGDEPPDGPVGLDFVVQSPPGRYLWLCLELDGAGFQTPVVESIRLRYPRQGLLQQLPALYASTQGPARFLERYLAIFEAVWAQIDERVAGLEGLFNPKAGTADELRWLAGRLALAPLGPDTAQTWRRLLQTVPAAYPRRGTPDAVKSVLQACLANISGVETADLAGLPAVVEGFRERRWLELDRDGLGPRTLAGGDARLVLGSAQVGVARIGAGDPLVEALRAFANTFRVFAPRCWVDTPQKEVWLREAIDAECPADTAYELMLFESRLRLGEDALLGVNSVLGPAPVQGATAGAERAGPAA